jgi:hypothetical protein
MSSHDASQEQLIQRLETQLRDAHATNARLREHNAQLVNEAQENHVRVGRAGELELQLEQASLQLRQAESLTAATVRKRRRAEADLVDAEARIEKLERRIEELQERADLLAELEIKIADAKSAKDLL